MLFAIRSCNKERLLVPGRSNNGGVGAPARVGRINLIPTVTCELPERHILGADPGVPKQTAARAIVIFDGGFPFVDFLGFFNSLQKA